MDVSIRRRRNWLGVALVIGMASATPGALGGVIYDVIDLSPGWAIALNDSRQVLIQEGANAVLWQDGTRTTLFQGTPTGLNASGWASGYARVGNQEHGVVYAGGTLIDLGPGRALAINDHGRVIGYSYDDVRGDFFYTWENGVLTPLDLPNPDPDHFMYEPQVTEIRALNNHGDFAGWSIPAGYGLIYRQGVVTILHGPTLAWDLNELGVAAITRLDVGENPMYTAYLWNDGTLQQLNFEGDGDMALYGINNQGQAVGWWGSNDNDPVFAPDRAILWQNGQRINLHSLLAPDSAIWSLSVAYLINEPGDIIAYGHVAGDRLNYYVLLRARFVPSGTAVPEPSSLALAGIGGLIGLGAALRARRRGRPSSRPAPGAAPAR
jgi:hypothetical protein